MSSFLKRPSVSELHVCGGGAAVFRIGTAPARTGAKRRQIATLIRSRSGSHGLRRNRPRPRVASVVTLVSPHRAAGVPKGSTRTRGIRKYSGGESNSPVVEWLN
eukprot:7800690-Pyramimonas_sp.AAC.1